MYCKFCQSYLGIFNLNYYCEFCSNLRRTLLLYGKDELNQTFKNEYGVSLKRDIENKDKEKEYKQVKNTSGSFYVKNEAKK